MKKTARSNSNHQEIMIDPNKVLSPDVLRTNLLLSSLYLTAYEMLKMAIVEDIKDFFIFQSEITDDIEKEMLKSLQKELVERFRESYQNDVDTYENEVGISLDDRDKTGLIPSCKWLQKHGALSEADIDEIKVFRDHRNEIAHKLPTILVGEGFNIKVEYFQRMRALIHKIGVFWARNDLLFDPVTFDEIDLQDVSDEEIISGRGSLLELITNAVVEYLKEISQTKSVS